MPNKPQNSWHLDKRLSLSLIIALVAYIITMTAWATTHDDDLKTRVTVAETKDQEVLRRLDSIENKIDRYFMKDVDD